MLLPKTKLLLLSIICCFLCNAAWTQDSLSTTLSEKFIDNFSGQAIKKTGWIEKQANKKSEKALARFAKQEEKMKRKLAKIDSLAAKNIFTTTENKLRQLQQNLMKPGKLTQYIPHLDTLTTSLKFLQQNQQYLTNAKDAEQKLKESLSKIDGLKERLEKAEAIKNFLKEEKQYLQEQLGRFGFAKELKAINKDVYYYSEQIKEYKEIISDPDKLEKKAIEMLSKTKFFQDFLRKNSMLASLFRLPDDNFSPLGGVAGGFAGLQTRTQVNSLIQQQISAGGPNAMQQFQQNLQQAQSQIQQLKTKILGSGSGSSDDIMPEGFKPNNQKTKSFLKRLEYGTNIQTQRASSYFPVTSDIGLSVGYKLNDKSVIGIGASYKLGWGTGWKDIHLTQQGAGLRSFLDWKIPSPKGGAGGGLWLSGGFEMNYKSQLNGMLIPSPFGGVQVEGWQQSGLLGLSKVVSVKSKLFKKTKVQVLWDFLSYKQVPRTQPILFRVGYSLK